jgi:hypothetical protein
MAHVASLKSLLRGQVEAVEGARARRDRQCDFARSRWVCDDESKASAEASDEPWAAVQIERYRLARYGLHGTGWAPTARLSFYPLDVQCHTTLLPGECTVELGQRPCVACRTLSVASESLDMDDTSSTIHAFF